MPSSFYTRRMDSSEHQKPDYVLTPQPDAEPQQHTTSPLQPEDVLASTAVAAEDNDESATLFHPSSQSAQQHRPRTTPCLFIRNIPQEQNSIQQIYALFASYGTIKSVALKMSQNRFAGAAHIYFATAEEAESACASINAGGQYKTELSYPKRPQLPHQQYYNPHFYQPQHLQQYSYGYNVPHGGQRPHFSQQQPPSTLQPGTQAPSQSQQSPQHVPSIQPHHPHPQPYPPHHQQQPNSYMRMSPHHIQNGPHYQRAHHRNIYNNNTRSHNKPLYQQHVNENGEKIEGEDVTPQNVFLDAELLQTHPAEGIETGPIGAAEGSVQPHGIHHSHPHQRRHHHQQGGHNIPPQHSPGFNYVQHNHGFNPRYPQQHQQHPPPHVYPHHQGYPHNGQMRVNNRQHQPQTVPPADPTLTGNPTPLQQPLSHPPRQVHYENQHNFGHSQQQHSGRRQNNYPRHHNKFYGSHQHQPGGHLHHNHTDENRPGVWYPPTEQTQNTPDVVNKDDPSQQQSIPAPAPNSQ